jgi:hypothetical protein
MDYSVNIGSKIEKAVFHDGATAVAQGAPFQVNGFKTLTIEIFGSATSASVAFKATSASGTSRVLTGVKISDLSMGTTGAMGDIWQFDVTGLYTVIMDLTAVTGGNVSVAGRAVA